MSDQKHTEGLWLINKIDVACEDQPGLVAYQVVNESGLLFVLEDRSLVDHIVQRVNACAGLNPSAVPGLVEAAQRVNHTLVCHGHIDKDTPLHEFVDTALADAKIKEGRRDE